MKPRLVVQSGARAAAADVVSRVLDDGAWAQPALASVLSSSQLDARDKALCTELVYGTLRWAVSLEKSLLRSADKPGRGLDKKMRPHLLVAAYQLQHLSDRIPAHAAVNEAVDAVRAVRPGLDGFANALLRRLGSPVHATLAPTATVHDVADAIGVPHVLADAVAGQVGATPLTAPATQATDEVRAALLGLNARPSTWAYDLLGRDPTSVAAVDKSGAAASSRVDDNNGARPPEAGKPSGAHRFVPGAYVLEGGAVVEVGGFKEGGFVVMDPGSIVAALLVAPKSGERVIDLCAAPGGKSVVLAKNGAHVVAVEKSDKRAQRIRENAQRTKLGGKIEVVVADAMALPANVRATPADAVLLDAPCSGFGTTRRKPEIKMRRTQADIDAETKLQRQLLARAADLVKPGGVLVYSVCSPLPAEGTDVVEDLLRARADFSVDDVGAVLPWLPKDAIDARGFVHLLPHRHDCDAFFCARLIRRDSTG